MNNDLVAENFNTLLVIPPSLVLLVIVVLVSVGRWRRLLWDNKLITGLIGSLLVMNILEVLTYGNFYDNYNILLRVYYGAAILTSSLIITLSEKLNESPLFHRNIFYTLVFFITTTLILFVLFTNVIVTGYFRNSYTILRKPGDYYWLFQVFVLTCISLGPYLIWRSIKTAINPLAKKRNEVMFIAFIPISITCIIVITLMQLGLNLNWSIFLPLCTLCFVSVYLFTENKQNLFRFLTKIPYLPERAAYNKLNQRVIDYVGKIQTDEQLSLKEMMSDIERTFVANAIEIKDGDHNLAAELLSVSLSTIYRNKDRKNTDKDDKK